MEKSLFTTPRLLFVSAVSALIVYLLYLGEYLYLFSLPDEVYIFMVTLGFTALVLLIIAIGKTVLARKEFKGFRKYWPLYFLASLLTIIVVVLYTNVQISKEEHYCFPGSLCTLLGSGSEPPGSEFLLDNYSLIMNVFFGVFISCWLAIAIAIKRLENK